MRTAAVRAGAMTDADLELVERHRYGDSGAFEELYRSYGSMVYNLALRLTGDAEEAADLCQETFLRVHRHLVGFEGRCSLRTWIYRVALNCCRSHFRRQRAWRAVRSPDSEQELKKLAARGRSPEQRAMARGTAERVATALAELPRIFREAVVLRDLEGLSYAEIAAVLKLRPGTVRSRIARGRERLRLMLEASR